MLKKVKKIAALMMATMALSKKRRFLRKLFRIWKTV